ncbi:hypothetical protein NGM10_06995 [Halorussus salilacus]|uniref:hypothetical protein n=1 Tax=Halorussus salilacus TaxID=2953750 RepID=UPI00209FF814|nr:hypothetical protein [Halorussus salilacus]USZ69474.1 hypothetical protein NGM10_06995 [Halorussus salilacus]
MSEEPDPELSDAERRALHEMQVGIEHVRRGYGDLLDFHHEVGRAGDRFESAREQLREAGRDELADELRDRHLPAGVVGDMWTYEVVSAFEEGFLSELTDFEASVREELADGIDHVSERAQQAEWRERADGDAWRDR